MPDWSPKQRQKTLLTIARGRGFTALPEDTDKDKLIEILRASDDMLTRQDGVIAWDEPASSAEVLGDGVLIVWDEPAPAPAPAILRYEIHRGSYVVHGLCRDDEQEAVRARAKERRGSTVEFYRAAVVGDRVVLSNHGSRTGVVVAVLDDACLVRLDDGTEHTVRRTACSVPGSKCPTGR